MTTAEDLKLKQGSQVFLNQHGIDVAFEIATHEGRLKIIDVGPPILKDDEANGLWEVLCVGKEVIDGKEQLMVSLTPSVQLPRFNLFMLKVSAYEDVFEGGEE